MFVAQPHRVAGRVSKICFRRRHPPLVKSSRALLPTIASTANMSSSGSDPSKIRVYTRTGDKGTSMLFNGERREKRDPLFMALGDVDELNAYVGLALEHCKLVENHERIEPLVQQLAEIQSRLLDAGSAIATPLSTSKESQTSRVRFDDVHVQTLEQWIDQMDDQLPPLRNFILPVRA